MSVLAPASSVQGLRPLRVRVDRRLRSASRVAPLLALAGALIGGIVLVGWYAEIPAFRSVLPQLATMKVNTAVGLFALGVAVALLSVRRPRRLARRTALTLTAGTLVLALATLLEYVLQANFGIDEFLRRDDGTNVFAPFPGRMAIATITAFTFTSAAVLASVARRRTLAAGLAVGSLALGWLSLLGYMYGYQEIGGLGSGTQMAIHTAAAHTVIAIAVLSGPLAGGTSVFSRATIGGSAARRVAVASLVLLPIVGLMRVAGERAGLFELGFGVTMMTAVSTIVVVIIAIWLGRSIERVTTQRDTAAADLEAMFARYRAASEASLDAFYLLGAVRDDHGQIVDFVCLDLNSRAAASRGQTVEALRGTRMRNEASPDEADRFIAGYASVVESGTTTESEFHVDRAGRRTWMRHQVMKVGDGVALMSRDVSDVVQARDALTAANRQLEERNADLRDFASVVSHDIRAPLRRIQMYGEQLELDAGERLGDGLPLLQRIRASAAKLEQLVAGLLSYARVDEGERPLQSVDLGVLVAEVLEDLELSIRESGGSVEVGPLPVVEGEPVLLRQLLTNLVGNAIKFRRADVLLRIVVAGSTVQDDDGNWWNQLVVRDNGIGFDQQYADRIFRIFERLHGERDYAGTGIGLAICRKIALYHRGTIEATGSHGDGATFTVRLPRPGPEAAT